MQHSPQKSGSLGPRCSGPQVLGSLVFGSSGPWVPGPRVPGPVFIVPVSLILLPGFGTSLTMARPDHFQLTCCPPSHYPRSSFVGSYSQTEVQSNSSKLAVALISRNRMHSWRYLYCTVATRLKAFRNWLF